jgi:hypothetical protein
MYACGSWPAPLHASMRTTTQHCPSPSFSGGLPVATGGGRV